MTRDVARVVRSIEAGPRAVPVVVAFSDESIDVDAWADGYVDAIRTALARQAANAPLTPSAA